jgi:hypothetical protein
LQSLPRGSSSPQARASAQAPDVERALVERFGPSPGKLAQLRGRQVVTRILPNHGPEMAVFGAVWIPDDKERLVGRIRDVEGFRKAADLGLSGKLSSPPAITDFGELVLEARELQALARCKPGDCAVRLGDRTIARFQTAVVAQELDAGLAPAGYDGRRFQRREASRGRAAAATEIMRTSSARADGTPIA